MRNRIITILMAVMAVITAGAETFKVANIEYEVRTVREGGIEGVDVEKMHIVNCKEFIDSVIASGGKELIFPSEVTDPQGKKWKITHISGSNLIEIKHIEHVSLPDCMELLSGLSSCPDIKTIDLGKCLHTIWTLSLSNLPSLEKLEFPKSLSRIHEYSLNYLDKIEYIKLPELVKYIDSEVLSGCKNLKTVDLSAIDELTFGFHSMNALPELTEIIMPKTVKRFESGALCELPKIEEITLPQCSNDRDYDAWITYGAFRYLDNLKKVVTTNRQPPAQNSVKFGVPDTSMEGAVNFSECELWVPEGSAELYRNDECWNMFARIIEYETTSAGEIVAADKGFPVDIEVKGNNINISGNKVSTAVYSVSGLKLYEGTTDGELSLNLTPGLYIINANGQNRKISVK